MTGKPNVREIIYKAAIIAFGRDPNARVQDIGLLCGKRKAVIHYYMLHGIEQLRREAWDYYVFNTDKNTRNYRYELASMSHAMTRPDLAEKVRAFLELNGDVWYFMYLKQEAKP